MTEEEILNALWELFTRITEHLETDVNLAVDFYTVRQLFVTYSWSLERIQVKANSTMSLFQRSHNILRMRTNCKIVSS